MDVLNLSDVPNLLEIIEKLFNKKRKKGCYSKELDDDTVHYCNRKTGEFIIYTVKTEPRGVYVIEMVEAKNGTSSCAFSVYSTDLGTKTSSIIFASMPLGANGSSTPGLRVSRIAHDLKICPDLEYELSKPTFVGKLT